MYTIESVGPTKEWSGAHGPMLDYQIKFKEEPEWVTVTQKPSTPAPAVGQTLNGSITPTQYGKKFKKEQVMGGGASSSPRQPLDHDSMYRCNALNNATALVAGSGAKDEVLPARVTELADALYAWLKGSPVVSNDGDPGFTDEDMGQEPSFDL